MGKFWDELTARKSSERSQEILRAKFPHERGLSKETMDAVIAGEVEIVDDDPQSRLLKDISELE